jgi:cell division septal protein FtsQ
MKSKNSLINLLEVNKKKKMRTSSLLNLLGILLMFIGIVGGIAIALLFLAWGVIDIIKMIETNTYTFSGVFWAIVKITFRDIIAFVIGAIFFVVGGALSNY